jgi:integrase
MTARGPWIDARRDVSHSPAAMYLGSLGEGSRRTITQALTAIAAMVAGKDADPLKFRWERLDRSRTVQIRTDLKHDYSVATANKMLSALRGVLRSARSMGLMTEAQFQAAASLEQIVDAHHEQATGTIPTKAIKAMFAACAKDSTAAGRRDAALLAIFFASGLRRSEACELDVGDVDLRAARLSIRGERPEYHRLLGLSKPVCHALADWLAVRSAEPGPLLLPVDRGGLIRFRRLTDQAVYDIFGRIATRAGVPELTLRDLRRTYLVSLIRAGKSLDEVQYLIGHASWFTTATHRELAADADASGYDIEHLPYIAPKGGVT